ncbi:MAG: MTAP family purine nucleoside phosphorylase [Actinomycetota bacterium]
MEIPEASFAIIGGSSTFSLDGPAVVGGGVIDIIDSNLTIETSFGESPRFKLFTILDNQNEKKRVLTCKMHGWRPNVDRGEASSGAFWVLKEAGVKKIIAEGGVGSINHLLNPRDIIIPTDFIDFTGRKGLTIVGEHLLIMRQPVCPQIHAALLSSAQKYHQGRVFERGIYLVTEGPRFESRAEVSMMKQFGADVVGQSLSPEVYLARDIGACYAGVYMVVNYAEGIVKEWEHDELKDIFHEESKKIGQIVLEALRNITDSQKDCGCMEFRKPTLLRD